MSAMRTQNTPLYFEDLEPGKQFTSENYTVSIEEAIGFAQEYDPQYFHIDEAAAKSSLWGKLVVSGWHTAAISMRLKAKSPLGQVAGGLVGLGIESVKWPHPVYPGDTLHLIITIESGRISTSKPMYGVVRYKVETLNQNNVLVMEMMTAVWVPRRAV